MTRLYTDPDGPGSYEEIYEYVRQVLLDNWIPNKSRESWPEPYDRSARAITLSVLTRLGITPLQE